jgi:hypothetical protein
MLLFMFLAIAPLTLPAYASAEAVSFTRQGDTIRVVIGGKPFTVYHFDPKTAKAYLQPLRGANGVVVTRGFPIGDTIPVAHQHDPSIEPHQRAMYFGHGTSMGMTSGAKKYSRNIMVTPTPRVGGEWCFARLTR